MDIVRPRKRTALPRGAVTAVLVLAVVAAAAFALPHLFVRAGSDEPAIDGSTLVLSTVTRGTLVRSVSASGTFEPDRVAVVATAQQGTLATIAIRAGSHIVPGEVLATLTNPDLDAAVADATAQIAAARADVRSAVADASTARLEVAAAVRSANANAAGATVQAGVDASLYQQGLIGSLPYRSAEITRAEDHDLAAIAERKIGAQDIEGDAKIAALDARVDQLEALLADREAQRAALVVRSGVRGIVQSVAADPGQHLDVGGEIARVADLRDLEAVLQVAETDLRGVAPGERVTITSTDLGTLSGHVERIAPAAADGTVPVDVTLTTIPPGARPSQDLEGTIVLSRTPDALSIERPVNAQDGTTTALYRLSPDGSRAVRTNVRLGSGSAERIRVLAGLQPGDRVIVSDTSADDAPVLRVR